VIPLGLLPESFVDGVRDPAQGDVDHEFISVISFQYHNDIITDSRAPARSLAIPDGRPNAQIGRLRLPQALPEGIFPAMNAPPDRLTAALADRYRLEQQLGEGGMAKVYLAQDLKHNRRVAVKVLKPELAAVVGAERFLSEIETTANLQHPHILPLFDSGEADGFLFYVMPYIEGETLRERLEREQQLPVSDAVGLVRKVASALQYAHEQGVVHRDIKPANILLSRDEPLVADFGIAIAVSEAGGGRITETGLSLGTPHYMSPEQAAGERSPDTRSDLYALACVLFEMLAGEPPHGGGPAQSVFAKILTAEVPRVSAVRRSVPQNVDGAIAYALEKLPADRPASVGEWVRLLNDAGYRYGEAAQGGGGSTRPIWKVSTGILALTASVLAWATFGGEAPRGQQVFRAELSPPGTQGLLTPQVGSSVLLSPDGQTLLYAGQGEGQPWQFWIRPAASIDARPLVGSGVHFTPEYEPGGERLALVGAEQQLNIFDLNSNSRRELTRGASQIVDWNSDGWIYYFGATNEVNEPFNRIDPDTGEIEVLAGVVRTRAMASAWGTAGDVLPDGRTAVLTRFPPQQAAAGAATVAAVDLETGEYTILAQGFHPTFMESGHLVWATADGRLMAQSFDTEARELRGTPVVVADRVMFDLVGIAHYSVSEEGSLVYRRSPINEAGGSRLSWVDRSGNAAPASNIRVGLTVGLWDAVSVSPDGSRAVLAMSEGSAAHIFSTTLDSDSPPNRLTFDGILNVRPRFADDGETITFVSDIGGRPTKLYARPADGTGTPQPVVTADREIEEGFMSQDGEWYVYRLGGTSTNRDIFARRADGSGDPIPIVVTEASERAMDPSPDGTLLAYTSDETGRDEVFVTTFPDPSLGKWQVSQNGGGWSRWNPRGGEIFFESSDNQMMAASYTASGNRFSVTGVEALFSTADYLTGSNTPGYDLHPDGDRFLMIDIATGAGGGIVWVRNWIEELKAMSGG